MPFPLRNSHRNKNGTFIDVSNVYLSEVKSIGIPKDAAWADINNDKVILVLETAEEAGNIDINRAEKSLDKAQSYLDDKSNDVDRAFKAIQRAKNRIAISKKNI